MRAERFRCAVSAGPYGRFARYYDAVYDGVLDYHADCDYLDSLFRRFLRRRPKSVLDLGCGTGSHAIELGRRGYEVVGLDLSKSQLAVAGRKLRGKDLPVTFVQGTWPASPPAAGSTRRFACLAVSDTCSPNARSRPTSPPSGAISPPGVSTCSSSGTSPPRTTT